MPISNSTEPRDSRDPTSPAPSTSSSRSREACNLAEVDDPESAMSTVARLLEQLHGSLTSLPEKEVAIKRLLELAKAKKDARILIGSHSQAMPLFISILRSGASSAKVNAAALLSALCKEEDLRVKVLLGGCIPPLLSLLKSESAEAKKAAAEAIFEVSSGGLSDDHIGMKIFVTEGVVPTLWDLLNPKSRQDRIVEGFVTGALRNLCGDKDGYWKATLEAGGVEIITGLLSSKNTASQSNAASLLARLISAFSDSIPKIIAAGAVKALLQLLNRDDDIAVRESAADALEALSSKSTIAKKAVVDAGGLPVLIGAVVAPSKECMRGVTCHSLQSHAVCALSNICGGATSLLLYLGELCQSPRSAVSLADILGALAYTLMVYDGTDGKFFDPVEIESILVVLLKSHDSKLLLDRILEALASLYANACFSGRLDHSNAKKVLVGLVTMATDDVQDHLVHALTSLCCDGFGLWDALGKREGVQLLISLLGLSSEQHQEYAVSLLAILSDEVDDSKWAITAAGGIPPLVQLLETGSQRAKEDAAHIICNLCCHSDDIRACVESAGAVLALLWLLKSDSPRGQEASVKALKVLIRSADSATINQLLALLLSDSVSSKAHAITVLGHVLVLAPQRDLIQNGAPANKGLRSLVLVLDSSNEESQECAATVLADIFSMRQDICDILATDEIVQPFMKLLTSGNQVMATQSARALGALSRSANTMSKNKMSCIAEGDVQPLIEMAKTSSIDAAEAAIAALANLLSDSQIAKEALGDNIVQALTRVLKEGSLDGKISASRSLYHLLNQFPLCEVFPDYSLCCFIIHALLVCLSGISLEKVTSLDPLDVLALMVMTKEGAHFSPPLRTAFLEAPEGLEPLVRCISVGLPPIQDKSIQILARLCQDQSSLLSEHINRSEGCIDSLVSRVMESTNMEIRISSAITLISALKDKREHSIEVLEASGHLKSLISALIDMLKQESTSTSLDIEVWKPYTEKSLFNCEQDVLDVPESGKVLEETVARLLSLICSSHPRSKLTVMDLGGVEIVSDKLASASRQEHDEDSGSVWSCALLLATLFQDSVVVQSSAIMRIIPSLASLLRSDEIIDKYFAAQSLASLVCTGSRSIQLAIANSGAVVGAIAMIGLIESDMPNLVTMAEEFKLAENPSQIILKSLFDLEDVRTGATARRSIPLLVDILKPMADKPGAPLVALHLLTQLAEGSETNKVAMAEAGALDALTMYLSLSPQDSTETTIINLLGILYKNPDLLYYESSLSTLNQLVAVLRLGSRNSRLSAARTLHNLFDSESIRDTEVVRQAIQPLLDMLESGTEIEQQATLGALIKLSAGNISKASAMFDVEGNTLESLYKILSFSSSLELKKDAAQLCYVLFENNDIRASPIATECLRPLISLMSSGSSLVVEPAVCALSRLLDEEHNAEIAATNEVVELLVSFVPGTNYQLSEASIAALIKLGKDRPNCKLDMVKAGIIEHALDMILDVPVSVGSSIAELLRILTNNSGIAKSSASAKMVEPLFLLLRRPDVTMWDQHSALQALVNILEKPQSLATLKSTPSQIIEPLISFLESPSQAIQQLGTEVLSHLLEQEHFQQDITTKNAVVPLVQLAGIGILSLQQTAVKALENISQSWPKAVADAGGIFELSKVIVQDDPQPSQALWESAALVLCNVLRYSSDNYVKVSLAVLVRLLNSTTESTVTIALGALLVQEKSNSRCAVAMAEAGAVRALLELLKSHRCEESAARLLEALINNSRVRETKVAKHSIAPLSQYLLDPQSKNQAAKFLVTLALGDIFQHEALARASDSVSACRALVSLLEDQPTDDMTMVAICALQSLVMHSRTNRRAVAEAGGILVVQELLLSPNVDIAGQAALLIKYLFSNHTLQEYVSNELIRSLTAALERELLSTSSINEVILRTIYVIFSNFRKVRFSEAATLCIPHLVCALKDGNEAAQESVLDTLCLLKESWPQMNEDIAKAQSLISAEAIPVLQMLMKTCPPSFHDRADSLLHCLPGCLTVTILRGNNLKQTMGSTNAFCCLQIGNGPPRQTKLVNQSICPVWNEGFTWLFDIPPKGQKLYILCKSKNTFGKSTLGRVTIQIDKVVTEGVYSGFFSLSHDGGKDGSRTLEIEIVWSNRPANDSM
ncbi:protein CELLULOSE SYNTHASE INTERACTIVE 3 [Hordeum vulgare subsp. vulgare]|uniref:C2 domain-containing protein n=1 Tax=Hordeum vulgare subsp. vulgare TaxID=112509 RepID=A0A8I6XXU2_HORVV|nr:protein CELLULOSE SYNTHASE INTERACTIVE 3 [Hordeum vulgare subsp. vulgare]XP_044980604.1 protein CELLULOSE SYNTHASE INTERACTIVE 3 [Hordeum vulgare subsp. vulgare]